MNSYKSKRNFSTGALIAASIFYFGASFGVTANNRPPSLVNNVPFTRQAPLGEWSDPRQADGCEEASMVMAMAWVRDGVVPPEEAKRDIVNISEYERAVLGFYQDTSIQDTARIMRDYYNFQTAYVQENISSENIKTELSGGNLVMVALNTRLTGMTLYKTGPTRHMVLAVGYDDQSDEVIVHDPYYAAGKYLRIKSAALDRALWNYRSGIHLPSGPQQTAMISISR